MIQREEAKHSRRKETEELIAITKQRELSLMVAHGKRGRVAS